MLPAKVWSTGAIAYEINLAAGDSSFKIVSTNPAGKTSIKTIRLYIHCSQAGRTGEDFRY
jgi:hypothetical protein